MFNLTKENLPFLENEPTSENQQNSYNTGINFSFSKPDKNEKIQNNNFRLFGKDVKNTFITNNNNNFIKKIPTQQNINACFKLLAKITNSNNSQNNFSFFNNINNNQNFCNIKTKPKLEINSFSSQSFSSIYSKSTVKTNISSKVSQSSINSQNNYNNYHNNNNINNKIKQIKISKNEKDNNNYKQKPKESKKHVNTSFSLPLSLPSTNSNSNLSKKNYSKGDLFDLKTISFFSVYSSTSPKNSDTPSKSKIFPQLKTLFHFEEGEELPFEIEYFLNYPTFTCDFGHENDLNLNYEYLTENFLDILLISYRKKMIMKKNILPLTDCQKEISFAKRNILISWLTEINFKYIKDQNILFIGINLLDRILYKSKNKEQIQIKNFQLLGIICFNLALKMENIHKVFDINEIIALIGGKVKKNSEKELNELKKKIIKSEEEICDDLDFDFDTSSSVLILRRLIQILNIQNKQNEKIFSNISMFFLEISLYNEDFFYFYDFIKALGSLLLTREIMKNLNIKIGFHNYLINCSKIYFNEVKNYCLLVKKTIHEIKKYIFGQTIFYKYQNEEFGKIINNYLNGFIKECTQEKVNDNNKNNNNKSSDNNK